MSKVYYTNLEVKEGNSLLKKLKKLLKEAGLETIDFVKKDVALKIHFGEPGNMAYLRPNYSKVIADYIKELGGRPFLTDSNTLYVGRRNHGLAHLEAAYENGYNPFTTGCHILIADGLKGTDDVEVPIDGEYVKNAKIGRAIMDADIFISVNHFKGHVMAGFGGALKNIGMGSGSRRGKMEMHNAGKPVVNKEKCIGCKNCSKYCNQDAFCYDEARKANINHEKCVGCGRCIGVCPTEAIHTLNDEAKDIMNKKIAEYSLAVIKDRPNFHINFVINVSPGCDCHAYNDTPIVQDIGIFASFDPVSLDQACVDAVNAHPLLRNIECTKDHFHDIHPNTDWEAGLIHAEKIGLGTRKYELTKIK